MTDIYIRRGEPQNLRRRALLILLAFLIILGAGAWLIMRGCDREDSLSDLEQQVEEDPLVGELIDLPDPEPARTSEGRTAPPTKPKKSDRRRDGKITPPADPGTDPGIRLVAEAQKFKAEGNLPEARAAANGILAGSRHQPARERAMTILSDINTEILLSPRAMPEKTEYTVQPGDSLAKLAKKFGTTVELIRQGNNVRGSLIRTGDRMRIFQGNFSIKVDKSDNVLDVYLNDVFFKRYPVGTGEYNRTPVGDFKITDRIQKPTWWRPDGKAIPYGTPENELGTHWLSLDVRGYGIHGTWEPDTIGKQVSAGCVRLLNENIEELYNIIPLGTPVTISD